MKRSLISTVVPVFVVFLLAAAGLAKVLIAGYRYQQTRGEGSPSA